MNSRDAIDWAIEQWPSLDTGGSRALLVWLARNSFVSDDNPEEMPEGCVMSSRSGISTIIEETGMSRSTIDRSLLELAAKRFILVRQNRGSKSNLIVLLWKEDHDKMRELFPPEPKETNQTKRAKEISDNTVVSMRSWKQEKSSK